MCHHLPLLPTLRVTNCMENCILQLDRLRCQGSMDGLLGMEEEWNPQGRHCVDIVFKHFEQCYLRQWGVVGQSIILLLVQLRWLFMLNLWYEPTSNGPLVCFHACLLSGLCPWEFVAAVFLRNIYLLSKWSVLSQFDMKVIHSNDGKVPNIYEPKAIVLAQVPLKIFQAKPLTHEDSLYCKSGVCKQALRSSSKGVGHTLGKNMHLHSQW